MRLDLDGAVLVADVGVRLQCRTGAGDQLAVIPGCGGGHLRDPDLPVRSSLGNDLAVDDVEIAGSELELLRGNVENACACLLGCEANGVAADERAARGEASGAHGGRVGVRVVVGDPVEGDAERVGDDLRVHGPRSLADVDRPGKDVDSPVGLELDPGLARVAVLIHSRGVLDRRDPPALVLRHYRPPPFDADSGPPSWATRCSGSRSPVRRSFVIDLYASGRSYPTRSAAARTTGT